MRHRYTYSGLGTLYDQRRADMKVYEFWDEALCQLEKSKDNIHPDIFKWMEANIFSQTVTR